VAGAPLSRAGREPVAFERQHRVGGRTHTIRRRRFTFEIDALIYLGSYTESVQPMREVGFGGQLAWFPAHGAMPRDGVLEFLDLS
jgi:phytoene dehydrogenase-like protein